MEEIEVPTEHIQEEIHHHAEESKERWVMGVALSSAFLAAFAAIAALMAGHHSNEAMIEQIQASDHWSHYQAKSIKHSLLSTKMQILEGSGKKTQVGDEKKLAQYERDQEELKDLAQEKTHSSEKHLLHHVSLAQSVTFFQIAITIGAVSVLTRRRKFWYLSMGIGVFGLLFLFKGLF